MAINKRTPGGEASYSALKPLAVFVATPPTDHLSVARRWIGKARTVVVEKPTVDLWELKRLQDEANASETRVLFFDHYRLRLAEMLRAAGVSPKDLGLPTRAKFFLFEEFTIEDTERYSAFELGAFFDLAAHFFGMISLFFVWDDVQYEDCAGGKYCLSEVPRVLAATRLDTLAVTKGRLSLGGVSCPFFVGVGLGLSSAAQESRGPWKECSIDFSSGSSLSLDLVQLSGCLRLPDGRTVNRQLPREPYRHLIEGVLGGESLDRRWFLNWAESAAVAEALQEGSACVNALVPTDYSIGTEANLEFLQEFLRASGERCKPSV